ncbi:MAG: hypothetical protein IKI57_01005 [Clostridia bacterium]|nr:hypothetical protein [Clostridia bacterium]
MFTRNENGDVNSKVVSNEIVFWAMEETEKAEEERKQGVLLCEGDENSIDCKVYSLVFPNLLVVPVGGCSNVMRIVPNLRIKLAPFKMYAFGIIDRDALSKKEIKRLLKTHGINTTKLPFIENIICAPETLRIICKYKDIDADELIHQVQTELMKILWQKFKETLPINLGIEKNEKLKILMIGASTKRQDILKEVDENNILYSYRDKIITVIIGAHIGIRNKKDYYAMIIDMINNPEFRDDLATVFAKFIPKLEVYDFEKY